MVERADPGHDLALLRVPAGDLDWLPLAKLDAVSLGLRVFTIGFPAIEVLGPEPKFAEGVVSSLRGHPDRDDTLLISVPVQPGASGGPLVDERGMAVGIILGSAGHVNFLETTGSLPQNVNWAIRADYAAKLLDAAPEAPAPASSREHAIERTRRAICQVEAVRG